MQLLRDWTNLQRQRGLCQQELQRRKVRRSSLRKRSEGRQRDGRGLRGELRALRGGQALCEGHGLRERNVLSRQLRICRVLQWIAGRRRVGRGLRRIPLRPLSCGTKLQHRVGLCERELRGRNLFTLRGGHRPGRRQHLLCRRHGGHPGPVFGFSRRQRRGHQRAGIPLRLERHLRAGNCRR